MKRITVLIIFFCILKGVLDNLKMQINILDADIKAMEKSKKEFERHLGMLEKKKEDLKLRMKLSTEWAATYDTEVNVVFTFIVISIMNRLVLLLLDMTK